MLDSSASWVGYANNRIPCLIAQHATVAAPNTVIAKLAPIRSNLLPYVNGSTTTLRRLESQFEPGRVHQLGEIEGITSFLCYLR